MDTIKPLLTKKEYNKLNEKEKIHITNPNLLNDENEQPISEQQIPLKPIENIWKEVYNKIKWVNKPKKSHPHFDYIYNELKEIYGEELGNQIMRIIMDIIEVEFHKINGKRIKFFDIINGGVSLNKWRKLINRVNKVLSETSQTSLTIQKLKN